MMSVLSRRKFLKASGAALATTALSSKVFAAGSERIRVGLIGCGGRGTGGVQDILRADKSVRVVALGDLFEDRANKCLEDLKTNGGFWKWNLGGADVSSQVDVDKENVFTGWDAYKKVIASDVDVIIHATPPQFRPMHLRAAVEAGKHVFIEKPAAVDPPGVRSVLESAELAEKKGLCLVAGTQRRHQNHYVDIIKRIHDGQIGEIVGGQYMWVGGAVDGYWHNYERTEDMCDMAYQCRNWPWYTWLSGDHIVEQHVHNLDIMNWVMQGPPASAIGMGGRQQRTAEKYGNIWDHFAVEYEYANGVRATGMCRQNKNTSPVIMAERVVGTKGIAELNMNNGRISGQNAFEYDGDNNNPYLQEQIDFLAAIRQGKPVNEGKHVAESTLTAIMGRISAYTGRAVKFDWVLNRSELDLSPEAYEWGKLPIRPVAVPGQTKLI